MSALFLQRCFRHPAREAAVRCPGCGRTFCRECVTEHEGRVLCAACLTRGAVAPPKAAARRHLLRGAAAVVGLVLAWLFFVSLGRLLLLVPTAFHEAGTHEAREAR